MTPRLFVFLAIAALGWSTQVAAQTLPPCPNGGPRSAAGICPVFDQGDPDCEVAAQICGFAEGLQFVFSPVPNSGSGITVTVSGTSATVKDTLVTPNQQDGRPGIEAIIARRNSAYIYCGTEILNDVVKAPGSQAPNQVTVCLAKGPCGLSETQLINGTNGVCDRYGATANFVQAYQVGPIEQNVNICGCSPFVARFCDIRAPIFAPPVNNIPQPRFVSCNPDGQQVLKSAEAESTATMGTNSCVMRTIGGRRILIDTATGSLC